MDESFALWFLGTKYSYLGGGVKGRGDSINCKGEHHTNEDVIMHNTTQRAFIEGERASPKASRAPQSPVSPE